MHQLTLTDNELDVLNEAVRTYYYDDPDAEDPLYLVMAGTVASLRRKVAEAMKAKETDNVETT